MGSGASKRGNQRRASQSRRKSRGRGAEANHPSLLRRRRVLFCAAEPDCILRFERVPPIKQYAADIPDEEDDPVFERFSGSNEANDFRKRAHQMSFEQDDGYLREEAIELLGLGLRPDSFLSRRLFEIAQAQVVYSSDNRRPLMTCYELLALYSVLRHGNSSELLELLFCVFDADDDDRVSIADLTIAIDAFQDFAEPGTVQHCSSKRVSQRAVDEINALEASEDKENSEADHDAASDDECRSVSSKTPLAGDNKPKKQQRRCGFCCGGKAPADSDDAPEPRKAKPKAKAARRGLCCSCGAGGKKEVPALSFDQWQYWLSTSELLPAGFAQEYGVQPPPSRGAAARPRASSAAKLPRSSTMSDDDDDISD